MSHHGTARAPERAIVPGRAWHGAAWRAGDLARMAQFQCRMMSRWEAPGALWLAGGVFCLVLFLIPPMPASAREFCTVWSGMLCALGAVTFAAARLRRRWRGNGAPGREL